MFTKLKQWLFGKPEQTQVQVVGDNSVGVQAKESVEVQVSGVPYKVELPTPKLEVEKPSEPAPAVTVAPDVTWPFDGTEEAKLKKPRKPRAKKPKAE
jgi:hypothetical protein